MTLNQFLATLKTQNVTVVVKNLEDAQICKVDAGSYSALDETVKDRIINRWYINGATSVAIVLNDEPVVSA